MEKITSCHLSFSCWHLVVRSRRSPLRLRTHGKQSAQQSNEICSESNDRLGLNDTAKLFHHLLSVLDHYLSWLSVEDTATGEVEEWSVRDRREQSRSNTGGLWEYERNCSKRVVGSVVGIESAERSLPSG